MKGYLFVTGCGRSGTTLLGNIISYHPRIILGVERFIKLCAENFPAFQPGPFEHERFFDFRGTDRKGFEAELRPPQRAYYNRMQAKWDDAWYRGDKLPTLFVCFDQVLERFGDVRFVHITRKIEDVATSFNARVEAGTFPADYDYKKAVGLWNMANIHALDFFEKHRDKIVLLDYERLLHQGNVHKMLNAIDPELGFPDAIASQVALAENMSMKIAENRKETRFVYEGQQEYIQSMADIAAYDAVMALSIFNANTSPGL